MSPPLISPSSSAARLSWPTLFLLHTTAVLVWPLANGAHSNVRFTSSTSTSTSTAPSSGQLSFLWRLLGISLEPVQSNTTPNPSNDPKTLPQGTSIQDCTKKWQHYYSTKKGPSDQIRCCESRRLCMCFEEVCKKDPHKHGCKGLSLDCHKQKNCRNVTVTDRQCVEFQDAGTRERSKFNWLWLLIALGLLMILCICISIWCVYRKKFTGKDSKKDKKHGKIAFGQPNVDSKVKWHGKKKKGSKRKRSSGSKASKKSSKRSSSKKSKKKSSKRS